ncbi:MAG: methylated-DNA--[protein]-cysteine S-methyltransferase [Treponema sp.]|jgi:methylated-DNA-[protein]-cysteine S-methyltransferase|nr:methylated-DNA--[protein]-cysteine S-methyltransferase [Treponema sp.]
MPQVVYTVNIDTPLGVVRAFAVDNALTGLWFADSCPFPADYGTSAPALPLFSNLREWLDIYFAGQEPSVPLTLKTNGTPFQEIVWGLLKSIPYGKTTSYSDLAKETAVCMGISRMAAQAVGGAVGRNPISIIIPCHRVIGKNGGLTGYGGGLKRKSFMLRLERCEGTLFI